MIRAVFLSRTMTNYQISFRVLLTVTLLGFLVPSGSFAQNGRDGSATQRLCAVGLRSMRRPVGNILATDLITAAMPGWRRDALGNLMLRQGSGSPRRVVACGLDRPGFAVTEITEEGLLATARSRGVSGSIRCGRSFTKDNASMCLTRMRCCSRGRDGEEHALATRAAGDTCRLRRWKICGSMLAQRHARRCSSSGLKC